MCFVVLGAILIYALVATFFITARILLPWTIAATVLAGLSALGIGLALRPKWGAKSIALATPLTIALTIGFGYVLYLINPPQPPPKQAANQDLLTFMFTLPKPEIRAEDLWTMLPVHLGISGVLGAIVVASLLTTRLPKEVPVQAEGESPFQKGGDSQGKQEIKLGH